MKKNSFYLFAMMMAVVLCVSFTSCSDDDDEGGSGSTNALVGTWQCVSNTSLGSDESEYLKFDAKGNTTWYYVYTKESSFKICKYAYEGTTLVFTWLDGTIETYEVLSVTESELEIKRKGSSDADKYKKVADSVVAGIK